MVDVERTRFVSSEAIAKLQEFNEVHYQEMFAENAGECLFRSQVSVQSRVMLTLLDAAANCRTLVVSDPDSLRAAATFRNYDGA
jgi:hypothetical protein